MKSKRNESAFEQAKTQLTQLEQLARQGWLQVSYYDESGFSLTSCLPYAWQEKGRTIGLVPGKGQRINVAGFYSKTGEWMHHTQLHSFKQQDVMAFFDRYCATIKQKTVVVLDNAPTHRSKAFQAKIKEWQEQDLYLFFLPAYSPELNVIEILWRQIKYRWLAFKAYLNFDTLTSHLEDILNNIPTKYPINFV